MSTIVRQVYDHIVQHPIGTLFKSPDIASKCGLNINPVSASLCKLEKKEMLRAVGKDSHAFVYEYIKYVPIRFSRRYAKRSERNRSHGLPHPQRQLPQMNGSISEGSFPGL